MSLPRTTAVVAAISATLFLLPLAPTTAHASEESSVGPLYMYGAGAAGAMALTFSVADIAYAADGRLLSTGWAVSQIVGGLIEAGWGALGIPASNDQGRLDGPVLIVGVALMGVGTWHIIHAIWSLAAGDAPTEEASLSVVPLEGGAMLSLGGRL